MTDEQIEEALETHVFHYTGKRWQTGEEYEYTNEGWYAWEEVEGQDIEVPGLGVVTVVENFGGEGEGDRYYLTFQIIPEDGGDARYFRMDGYHVSHDGSYYDGPFTEVKKTTKLMDVYE